MKLLVRCLNALWKSFCVNLPFERLFLWHSESSSAVTLLLHTDWMILTNASNQGEANSMTVALADAGCFESCISWKLFGGLLLDFKWIFKLNASRRSINLPVYLVFDLEAGGFNFWVKIMERSNFCMEQSNFCMEQSVFDYGANWLLTIMPTYTSTVAQLPSLLRNL